ncbi:MAG: SDR family oxidoreductase [Bacteriovoracaceae bacterium]|nr:SDR family oxidoreductase [Bacteriovoracaceae bacterium]
MRMKDFSNRTVYVVGGSSGIGLAAAGELARRGAHIVIFGRDTQRLSHALDRIASRRISQDQRFSYTSMDVSVWREVLQAVEKTAASAGPPDVLINCAGRAYPGRFEDIGMDQAEETLKTNLLGCIHTCRAAIPFMKKSGGVIVNTSSVAGFVGVFGYTDYCASKYGLIGFSEALRSELKPWGIHVQVLCPPDTDTPGYAVENLTKPEETRRISTAARILTPEQVASALIRGMGTSRFLIIPGFESRLIYFIKRLFPSLVEWVNDRQIRQCRKEREGVR